MKDIIIEKVKELFAEGKIKGFIALREAVGHIGPHVFTGPEDLETLALGDRDEPGDARYPLAGLLSCLAMEYPQDTFAILVRGCDERALEQLMVESRVTPLRADRVIPIGFPCPPELADACQCVKPWPDALVAGEPTPGVDPPTDDDVDLFDQLEKWYEIFDRCVKCFGCRNICPVCACKECTIEREILVPQRELPPDHTFLMTRAIHMVGACVYCGLCEEACPADIPLKDLYRFAARIVGRGGVLPGARLAPEGRPLPFVTL